jgi:DNA mismatch repair protein MutS
MLIDAGTLRDLDVLSTAAAGGQTLLALVDRTRTHVGRAQLRHRLTAPAHSAEAILARQCAHQILAAAAPKYRALVDRADPDSVERYLDSNWQSPRGRHGLARFVEGHWRAGWRRQYLSEVENGQFRISALLGAATDLQTHLCGADTAVLSEVGKTIAALLNTAEVRELDRLGSRRSGLARLAFDQLARERAKPLVAEILDCVGMVEAMWSLAVATVEQGWSYPRPASRFGVTGLSHPFLWRRDVPNDLQLSDQVRVCFVTGPNMAGKSTFLKAVAMAMLLAHAGCGVPAASMEFPTVGTIFSSVKVSENLNAEESFYLAEIRRIRALAQALYEHGSALAVLDEPLRGTNVHDAAEATLAVMTRLAVHPNALVFIASHIGEIVHAVAGDVRIRLLHFAADVTGQHPRFDYRLREGMSAQRLGMTLLRQEQVLDLLERSAGIANSQPNNALHPAG